MLKVVLRTACLAGLIGLGGCVSSSDSARPSGPIGDVTNAPAGAGINVRAGSPEDFIVNVGRRIFFAQGSAELDDTAQETLNNQAAWLTTYTQYPVKVDGFSDDPGSAADNMRLGLRRADAAKAYLVSRGVDASRVRTRSSGNTRPTMRCADISCKAQNRHVRTVLDAPTRGGQQPANVPLTGTTDPVQSDVPDGQEALAAPAPTPASGTRVSLGSGGELTVRGRVMAEGVVRR